MTTVATPLLTAEEYLQLPDNGKPTELVRGRVVVMNVPTPRHGQICVKVSRLLGNFAEQHQLGHVCGNDAGIQTERNPDTMRGADVSFYSYSRVPPGPLPRGYLNVVPELVFEVRSPTDRRADVLAKVVEYLRAGVTLVVVLHEQRGTATVYHPERDEVQLVADQELDLSDVLPGFRVPVGRFFE
jgi:Uma2 family endonuclease